MKEPEESREETRYVVSSVKVLASTCFDYSALWNSNHKIVRFLMRYTFLVKNKQRQQNHASSQKLGLASYYL